MWCRKSHAVSRCGCRTGWRCYAVAQEGLARREQSGKRNADAEQLPEITIAFEVQIAVADVEHQLHAQAGADVLQHLPLWTFCHVGGEHHRLAGVEAVGTLLEDPGAIALRINLDVDREVGVVIRHQRAFDEGHAQITERAADPRTGQLRQMPRVIQRLAGQGVLVEAGLDIRMQLAPLMAQDFFKQLTFGRDHHLPAALLSSPPSRRATLPPIFRKRCMVAGGRCL